MTGGGLAALQRAFVHALASVASGLVAVVLLEDGRPAQIARAAVHRVRTLLLL